MISVNSIKLLSNFRLLNYKVNNFSSGVGHVNALVETLINNFDQIFPDGKNYVMKVMENDLVDCNVGIYL